MAFFKFFNLPKPYHFEYRPRYWDPRKEALEKRLKAAEERKKEDPEAMKARISSGFRRRQYEENSKLRSRYAMRSNIMLLAILVMLVIITLALLNTYFPALVEAVGE
jgi:hypothetical protein